MDTNCWQQPARCPTSYPNLITEIFLWQMWLIIFKKRHCIELCVCQSADVFFQFYNINFSKKSILFNTNYFFSVQKYKKEKIYNKYAAFILIIYKINLLNFPCHDYNDLTTFAKQNLFLVYIYVIYNWNIIITYT